MLQRIIVDLWVQLLQLITDMFKDIDKQICSKILTNKYVQRYRQTNMFKDIDKQICSKISTNKYAQRYRQTNMFKDIDKQICSDI